MTIEEAHYCKLLADDCQSLRQQRDTLQERLEIAWRVYTERVAERDLLQIQVAELAADLKAEANVFFVYRGKVRDFNPHLADVIDIELASSKTEDTKK